MEKLSRTKRIERLKAEIAEQTTQTTDQPVTVNDVTETVVNSPVEKKDTVNFQHDDQDLVKNILDKAKTEAINSGNRNDHDTIHNVIGKMKESNIIKGGDAKSDPTPNEIKKQFKSVNDKTDDLSKVISDINNKDVNDLNQAADDIKTAIEEDQDTDYNEKLEVEDVVDDTTENLEPTETVETSDEQSESGSEVVESKTIDEIDDDGNVDEVDIKLDQALQKKIVEETQQLQLRVNQYEEELEGVSGNVSYTSRILNIILIIFILILVVVIGLVITWILNNANIIALPSENLLVILNNFPGLI
ncbi:MAG: hypothetical protein ACK5G7_05285 [Erysipelotrichaceae bacterium]